MSLGTFKGCCFCIDLRTGSFIIAYLLLGCRSIHMMLSCAHLSGIKTAMSGQHALLMYEDLEFFKLILSFEILVLVFELLINIALINGLHKKIQDQVQMFYAGGFVFEVLRIIMVTVLLLRYARTMAKHYGPWQWTITTFELVGHLVYIYFLLCIRSYYFMMRKEETSQRWNIFADSLAELKVGK